MTTPSEFINMMKNRKRTADVFQQPSLSAFMPGAGAGVTEQLTELQQQQELLQRHVVQGATNNSNPLPPSKKPHLDLPQQQQQLSVGGLGASVGRSSWWQLGNYQPEQVQEMFKDNSAAAAAAAAPTAATTAQSQSNEAGAAVAPPPTTMNELLLQGQLAASASNAGAALGDYSHLLLPHAGAAGDQDGTNGGALDPTQQLQNNLIKQVMAIEALQQQQSLLSRGMVANNGFAVGGAAALANAATTNMMNAAPTQKNKSTAPSKKNQTKSLEPGEDPKFRAYHAENWTERFEELLQFREQMGHCLVPNYYPENPALAQWVKRQRYQKKLKDHGKRSTLSDDREKVLDEAGMVWDSHAECWSERLQELMEYRRANGDCNVPSRYKENRQLAIWVKRQRRQYKFYMEKQPSSMTPDRIETLESLGFVWDLRAKSKK